MRSLRRFAAISLAAALGLLGLVAPGAAADAPVTAGEPFDYLAQLPALSQPTYSDTIREVVTLPAADGVELYLEITRPNPATYPGERFPVILEASPYHGTLHTREGTRILPDPRAADGTLLGLTGYFAPRGYAVVMMDLRGTGRSAGCLDHLGPKDASDLKLVIEHLAAQDWSNGRVGMTGHSYVGSTPILAAAQRPRGLATIVPSAGLGSMYDHQFNRGVPWLLQYAGPIFAYEMLALDRHLPDIGPDPVQGGATGDNFGNDPQDTGCGLPNSAALAGTGQVTGQYELWHAQRDARAGAIDADIPIFMVHGVHDNAARIPAAEWFFGNRYERPGDKVWLGQWDHGSTNGRCGGTDGVRVSHPNCRFDQWTAALHAWFDRHLQQRAVDTGPAVEAFTNGEESVDVTDIADPETLDRRVVTLDSWQRAPQRLELYPDTTTGDLLFDRPTTAGSATFSTGANALIASARGGAVRFASAPLEEDTVFLGLPQLTLNAAVSTGEIVHLTATLYRVDADGVKEPLSFCAIQPQLRDSVHTITPVVPTQEMALPMQCFTMASWVPAGQSLELEVSGRTPHHATWGGDAQITVHTGGARDGMLLPELPGAVVYPDVEHLRTPVVDEEEEDGEG